MSETVFITAGTNIGDQPMSGADARAYRTAILAASADAGADIFLDGAGQGTWGDVVEASWVFGMTLPSSYAMLKLRGDLRLIARRFGQEAIGFALHDKVLFGESFVTAE